MKPITIALLILFWFAVAFDCYFALHGEEAYRYYSKCLLMPLLIAAFLVHSQKSKHKKSKIIISLALLFSLIGDLLLLQNDNSTAFIGGIFSFLIAHLVYISFFARIAPFNSSKPLFIFICSVVIGAYLIFLLSKIWLGIGKDDLEMPVILYGIGISIMLLSAVNTVNGGRIKKIAYMYFVPGAILFITSDSLLALDKYNAPIASGAILVMLTYAAAQFLIVTGAMRVIKK